MVPSISNRKPSKDAVIGALVYAIVGAYVSVAGVSEALLLQHDGKGVRVSKTRKRAWRPG